MTDVNEDPPSEDERRARLEAGVLAIRAGHGANCSSIGSVIDTIFASAVLGGAVLAAVVASLGREKVHVVGTAPAPAAPAADEPTGPTPTDRGAA